MAEVSIWQFISHAGLVVHGVMLLLLAASVATWGIIIERRRFLRRTMRAAERFEADFWSGIDLAKLHSHLQTQTNQPHGLSMIFQSGFQEFCRLSRQQMSAVGIIKGVERAMRASASREIDELEKYLSFLATVGSIAPYVGLFGTVWGIMTSFSALSTMVQASISTVAPGIAEALIATAMGLFAAIPAVVAYNYYARQVERLTNQYDTFQEEFSSLLYRQVHNKGKEPEAVC